MARIQEGIAAKHSSGIWSIKLDGRKVARFDQRWFSGIRHGAAVYYVDLNVDGYCEKVQPKGWVDELVARAKSTQGFEDGAEHILRSYLMDVLGESVVRTGDDQKAYLDALERKLDAVRAAADQTATKKVTIAILESFAISL